GGLSAEQPIRSRYALALLGATVLPTIPLVLGFLSSVHPFFDSLAHFRFHLSIAVIAASIPLLLTSLRREGLMALVLAAGALYTTLDRRAGGAESVAGEAAGAPQASYRMLHLNLRFDNATPQKVLSLIGETRPDVITLAEVSELWEGKL